MESCRGAGPYKRGWLTRGATPTPWIADRRCGPNPQLPNRPGMQCHWPADERGLPMTGARPTPLTADCRPCVEPGWLALSTETVARSWPCAQALLLAPVTVSVAAVIVRAHRVFAS